MMRILPNRLASNFLSFYKFCSKVQSALKIEDVLKHRRTYIIEDVVEYSKVSHDNNLLHLDTEFAQKAGFQDRLVQGMLVASLFPQIISSHFPGAVYVSQTLQFRQLAYVGDEVVGEVQAMDIRAFKKKYLCCSVIVRSRVQVLEAASCRNASVKFSTKCLKDGSTLVLEGEATAVLPTLVLQCQGSE